MDKLRAIIEEYTDWQSQALTDYISRIEGFRDSDFPFCIENAKSLLETIAKQICVTKGKVYSKDDNPGKILKLAFESLGYDDTEATQQVGRAIANIGTQMSLLRNQIGVTSHGRPLEEFETRKDKINKATSDFLLFSTELVCCFLIQLFETEHIRIEPEPEEISFEDNEPFNEFWDEQYGEFEMGDYSFLASQILYSVDRLAYQTEVNSFNSFEDEMESEE